MLNLREMMPVFRPRANRPEGTACITPAARLSRR
jgi:hypothetical protein